MVLVKFEDARQIKIATDFEVNLPSETAQTISMPLC